MERFSNDIWYQILQQLDDQEDFCSLALVCKSLYSLVIPRLYRTLRIGLRPRSLEDLLLEFSDGPQKKSNGTQWHDIRSLIGRLVANPSSLQARSVHEIEVTDVPDREDEDASDFNFDLDLEQLLATLVRDLPNLREFRVLTPAPDFEDLIRELINHRNQPELHLLGEDGSRAVTGLMPCVTTIRAKVNPYHDNPEKPKYAGLQELFFACPNLKSFSISEHGNYGGCTRWGRLGGHRQIYSFQLTGTEVFPPLESISLDGYRMEEWDHWRDNVNWSIVKSLSLGPQKNTHLLECFNGHVKNIKSLTVETYAGEGKNSCPELESFLLSFNTLEQLTIRGHSVPNCALTNHPRLRELCLHAIELPRTNHAPRPTLDVADLYNLDAKCPDLQTLELDIPRNDDWPQDILRALASVFNNLRHLTLHCEVGIDWHNGSREPLLPILDEGLAKKFGQTFFAWRSQPMPNTVTLKTGEPLRRFPQWPPAYSQDERRWSRTIRVKAPSNPGEEPVTSSEESPEE